MVVCERHFVFSLLRQLCSCWSFHRPFTFRVVFQVDPFFGNHANSIHRNALIGPVFVIRVSGKSFHMISLEIFVLYQHRVYIRGMVQSFLLILCTITRLFSQPNKLMTRVRFCFSSLVVYESGVGKSILPQLANHKAKKSNNQHNSKGLCHYISYYICLLNFGHSHKDSDFYNRRLISQVQNALLIFDYY